MIHPQAIVEPGVTLGARTRVWAFAHIIGPAAIGVDCNICDHTFIEGGVRLGDRVTVKCGVFLWDGLIVEDDVFIGPCAAFTNDMRPRSRQNRGSYLTTTLRQGCSLGANATILPGLSIGRWAMVAAGAVVTSDVADFSLVMGNPARHRGWVCRCGLKLPEISHHRATCSCGLSYHLSGRTLTESAPPLPVPADPLS